MTPSDTLAREDRGPLPLFDSPQPAPADRLRLKAQAHRVLKATEGLGWLTLRDIARASESPEASVSARLRELRHLGWTVERRNDGGGLWPYRVTGGHA